jgi:hypothetical protein
VKAKERERKKQLLSIKEREREKERKTTKSEKIDNESTDKGDTISLKILESGSSGTIVGLTSLVGS